MATDTIVAIATAPGRGGIGIVRLSGPAALTIGETLSGITPIARHAHFVTFTDSAPAADTDACGAIDEGLLLYFPAPHSFTGEDCVELQGHGGPVILDSLVAACINLGARPARPGEFSERAFLNNKIDLTQAEAIADLINASSRQAAAGALKSLQGIFSEKIHQLVESLIQVRMYVESAIDFPEEEIDFLSDGRVAEMLAPLLQDNKTLIHQAQQGTALQEGLRIMLAGAPNAGKSSLLNALAQKESAIVTDIAGTTRDLIREHIHLDGLSLHLVDTAGIRLNPDTVEKIGIDRTHHEIEHTDVILWVVDCSQPLTTPPASWPGEKILTLYNKVDLAPAPPDHRGLALSTVSGEGLDDLKTKLKAIAGFDGNNEGLFMARRRHLVALEKAQQSLLAAQYQLEIGAGELMAEDLRKAQQCLSEITGEFSADDLLGKIFSSFCIGK